MGVQKNIFPEMGAGGVQINRCFTEQIFSVKKSSENRSKEPVSVQKSIPSFS
jgi:hypothetical protein